MVDLPGAEQEEGAFEGERLVAPLAVGQNDVGRAICRSDPATSWARKLVGWALHKASLSEAQWASFPTRSKMRLPRSSALPASNGTSFSAGSRVR